MCWTVTHLSVILFDQSTSELNGELPAAQRLPLASEEWDQPLSAVGSRDKHAPLDLALCAPTGPAPSEWGLLCGSKVVHGEVAEQVGAGQVIEHQGQSLRVGLVPQQDPVQVADPPSLTKLVPLPARGQNEKDDNEKNDNHTFKNPNNNLKEITSIKQTILLFSDKRKDNPNHI